MTAAIRWYESRRIGLGSELFDGVVKCVESLQANPEMGSPISRDGRTRRLLLDRFPYQVIYRLGSEEIILVAVAHAKRRPGHWKHRR